MSRPSSSILDRISTKKSVLFLLCISLCLSLFFSLFKFNESPPCINADEAAFGYNAYSLLKTGADEYGNTLPVRLKSFGDYKMPLYSYLSVPFIATLGLNEVGVRSLNIFISLLFPFVVYFLIKELFEKNEIAAIGALLVSVSVAKGIVGRHAHEALLAAFLISLSSYFFIKFIKREYLRDALFFSGSLLLSLFAYQSSRLFAIFFLVFAFGYFIYKKKLKSKLLVIGLIVVTIAIGSIADFIYKPTRVENLLLFNNLGFKLKIIELRNEGGSQIFYNKLTVGVRDILTNEVTYFSPQFLALNGDSNLRFGYKSLSPMTLVEYIFIVIGFYYLFKNKQRWRYFLLSIVLVSPLAAALSWNGESLTRTLFLIVPLICVISYGVYHVLKKARKNKLLFPVVSLLIVAEFIFLFYSWDFYFNHYPKRPTNIRAWQCGYAEVTKYIKDNNNKSKFYITQKNGEPYIFLLFYLQYPPEKYQKQALLTAADEYGFGQIERFDKYIFSTPDSAFKEKNVSIIGYPDDFQFRNIDTNRIKKIIIGKEEIFWIYETQ